jgi:hypothetical protein
MPTKGLLIVYVLCKIILSRKHAKVQKPQRETLRLDFLSDFARPDEPFGRA